MHISIWWSEMHGNFNSCRLQYICIINHTQVLRINYIIIQDYQELDPDSVFIFLLQKQNFRSFLTFFSAIFWIDHCQKLEEFYRLFYISQHLRFVSWESNLFGLYFAPLFRYICWSQYLCGSGFGTREPKYYRFRILSPDIHYLHIYCNFILNMFVENLSNLK